MFKFTLSTALEAKKRNRLHPWVINYLNDEGGNQKLARTLNEKGNVWVDIVEYPLNRLKRVWGSEEDMIFHEDRDEWEKRVSTIMKSIKDGEVFPPIIVTDFWDDIHISDGTHRYEALVKLGKDKYWTIFCFEREDSKKIL